MQTTIHTTDCELTPASRHADHASDVTTRSTRDGEAPTPDEDRGTGLRAARSVARRGGASPAPAAYVAAALARRKVQAVGRRSSWLGRGFRRGSVREPRVERQERGGDDLRRRVMLRCVAAAAAWWTAGTAGLGFKSRRRAPRVDPMRRAGTGVAASHRCASRVDRPGRELGRGSRVGARGRWSRPQKAWRVPHATLSGRDEHVVPCRASRWRRGAAAARMLDRQALAPHRRLSRRPRGPGIGRIAR